jgi:hypothetical protein
MYSSLPFAFISSLIEPVIIIPVKVVYAFYRFPTISCTISSPRSPLSSSIFFYLASITFVTRPSLPTHYIQPYLSHPFSSATPRVSRYSYLDAVSRHSLSRFSPYGFDEIERAVCGERLSMVVVWDLGCLYVGLGFPLLLGTRFLLQSWL